MIGSAEAPFSQGVVSKQRAANEVCEIAICAMKRAECRTRRLSDRALSPRVMMAEGWGIDLHPVDLREQQVAHPRHDLMARGASRPRLRQAIPNRHDFASGETLPAPGWHQWQSHPKKQPACRPCGTPAQALALLTLATNDGSRRSR